MDNQKSNVKTISLTQEQKCIIDLEDYELVSQYKWFADKTGTKIRDTYYAKAKINRKNIFMHRLIMNAPKGQIIDHINGNSLDNRKSNLRIVSHHENCQNRHHERTSKHPGVAWNKASQKWRVSLKINKKYYYLGLFESENEAAKEYKRAIKEYNETGKVTKIKFPKQSSKFKGVCWEHGRGKWKAYTKINGKGKHLGHFDNELEAKKAVDDFLDRKRKKLA